MEDKDLRQMSLDLYQYLSRHIVGTQDTVRAKRMLNTLTDNLATSSDNVIHITSGSLGEGLEMKGSDLDVMFALGDVGVFQEVNAIKLNQNFRAYFQILTDDSQPGFVKLLFIRSTGEYFIDLCEIIGTDLYLSSEFFKKNFLKACHEDDHIHGPCISDCNNLCDFAICLHCSSWVKQAHQWIWRSNNAWPSDELKKQIIEHGVLIVPIGVKGSPNESIQWRISFSVGEKYLIYSFTHTQLLCYALMKIILKDLINSDPQCEDLLCSYHLKNIIFWLSEELPPSIWRPYNLVTYFMRCMERLIFCVEYTICVHYFIPENNMFENRIEGENRKMLLAKLCTLYTLKWRCIFLSPQLEYFKRDQICFQSNLFGVIFEQIVCSAIMKIPYLSKNIAIYSPIRMIQSYKCTSIIHLIIHLLSKVCYATSQVQELCDKNQNKELYKQYKGCQFYLVLGLHHDAVSGWLMVASLFYRMKQFKRTLEILRYVLEKCPPENEWKKTGFTSFLETSEIITSVGLLKAINRFSLNTTEFCKKSILIPSELQAEITDQIHLVPSIVYCHFLSFLCHYHLHNINGCIHSIRHISLTISQNINNSDKIEKAAAYNCLGVALQLVGDIGLARDTFRKAIQLDTEYNTALQRLSMLEVSGFCLE